MTTSQVGSISLNLGASLPEIGSVAINIDPVVESNDFVVCNLGSGNACRMITDHKEMDKAKECFERIKGETLEYLIRNGSLADQDVTQFKLFIMKDKTGVWECGALKESIDYSDMPGIGAESKERIDRDFESFQLMFADEAPVGQHSALPMYRAGYMGDISQRSGFVADPHTRSLLPSSMEDFCEKHLKRALADDGDEEGYYHALERMAIVDVYRKTAKGALEEEIGALEGQLRPLRGLRNMEEQISELEADKARLETILENLQRADQFAVNFACCRPDPLPDDATDLERIDAAYDLKEAAEEHLLGHINSGNWISSNQTELSQADKDYCALIGTFRFNSRAGQFIPYCKQRGLHFNNTAVEHNFLLGNVKARGANDARPGMEMFHGVKAEIMGRIEAKLVEADVRAAEIRDQAATRLAGFVGEEVPKDLVADFRDNVYSEGWSPAKPWYRLGF